MLNGFAFRGKMYYLCTSEEENAHRQRVFSSFFAENGPKNHCFTKHIEKFICRREISTGFSGNFSGQVGARIDDIGFRKVKRYLFSKGAFLSFRVNYSGRFLIANCAGKKCTARCSQRVAQRLQEILQRIVTTQVVAR